MKDKYLGFMNTKIGSTINVVAYIAFSNALVGVTDYFTNLDVTGQSSTYVMIVGIINVVLVALKQIVKK